MLTIHQPGVREPITWTSQNTLPEQAAWLDLVDPKPEERAAAEELLDLELPERDDMTGLGVAGSGAHHEGAITLQLKLYPNREDDKPTPLGIIVTGRRLVTVRFAPSRVLERVAKRVAAANEADDGGDLLVVLLQVLVNDMATRMQHVAADVAELSSDVFVENHERTQILRRKLVRVGQLESKLAHYRNTMLGVGRSVGLIHHHAPEWIDQEAQTCIKVLGSDMRTLDEFDDQLTEKLAFLQDAVLGFININQNMVMKVMTVASVVGIPPMLLAGIWGMNFKHMPELDKPWGYPMALAAVVLSTLLPLIWFGARGWLSKD